MANKISTFKDVVCPFCSLLCDDLTVENRNDRLTVLEHGCDKARHGFAAAPALPEPMIGGKPVSLEAAVSEAGRLLKKARQPLISGLGSDVAGSRAAMLLAERSRAVIDPGQSDAVVRNMLALQENGWIMTTLTELKNRADFVLFLGTDAIRNYPRFFERYIWNESSLFLNDTSPRRIAYLGDRLNSRPGVSPAGRKPLSVHCGDDDLIDYVTLLIAMLRDSGYRSGFVSGPQRKKLEQLAAEMGKARYGVIVWSPGELSVSHGELLVQSIADLIRHLNRESRFAGLSLGGDHGGASFINVCAWQSGYPLRVDYTRGVPNYHPWRNSTERLLSESIADVLVWIAAYESQPPRPQTAIPTIVLGRSTDKDARVFIPVGTPGLDHPGNLFRTDSVVNLPVRGLRHHAVSGVADILARINGVLAS